MRTLYGGSEDPMRRRQMLATRPVNPNAAATNNIASPDDPSRFEQYDAMKRRAVQQGRQAKQEAGEALKRRFASIGNLNSGAYIKAAGQQDQEVDKATNESVENIDFQLQGEKNRLRDISDERTYQSGEAEKGRIFNRDLFNKDMAFKQVVFSDESKRAWADLNESMRANKINALTAISNLSDDALEAVGGTPVSGGFLGIGAYGQSDAIKSILKKYGY